MTGRSGASSSATRACARRGARVRVYDEKTAEADVRAFLALLQERGLVLRA